MRGARAKRLRRELGVPHPGRKYGGKVTGKFAHKTGFFPGNARRGREKVLTLVPRWVRRGHKR